MIESTLEALRQKSDSGLVFIDEEQALWLVNLIEQIAALRKPPAGYLNVLRGNIVFRREELEALLLEERCIP